MRLILLIAITTVALSCSAKVEDRHLACTKDSDCVIIGTGGCCGGDLAINKNFSEQFKKPAREMCDSMLVECRNLEAKCVNDLCALVEKK